MIGQGWNADVPGEPFGGICVFVIREKLFDKTGGDELLLTFFLFKQKQTFCLHVYLHAASPWTQLFSSAKRSAAVEPICLSWHA